MNERKVAVAKYLFIGSLLLLACAGSVAIYVAMFGTTNLYVWLGVVVGLVIAQRVIRELLFWVMGKDGEKDSGKGRGKGDAAHSIENDVAEW